jgi:hypothetical protein
MKWGLEFERMLAEALRRNACQVTTCSSWDYTEKVDMLIPKIGGCRLKYAVEVQVTLACDDAVKMRRYKESRGNRRACSLYVEALNADPEDVATSLIMAIRVIMQMKSYAMCTFALRIGPGGKYDWFDLGQRIAELDASETKGLNVLTRCSGKVVGSDAAGKFIVVCGEETYLSRQSDVADEALRKQLRRQFRWEGQSFRGVAVSFIPDGHIGDRPRATGVVRAKVDV